MRNVRLPCDETSFELGITNQGPGTRFRFRFLSLFLSFSRFGFGCGFGFGSGSSKNLQKLDLTGPSITTSACIRTHLHLRTPHLLYFSCLLLYSAFTLLST